MSGNDLGHLLGDDTLSPQDVPTKATRPPSSNIDDEFSYITSEDMRPPQSGSSFGSNHTHDMIILSINGTLISTPFPLYSIADGKLLVGDIRDRALMLMNPSQTSGDQVEIYHKGRQLEDPAALVRLYGVKANDEIIVNIREGATSDEDTSTTTDKEFETLSNLAEESVSNLSGRRHSHVPVFKVPQPYQCNLAHHRHLADKDMQPRESPLAEQDVLSSVDTGLVRVTQSSDTIERQAPINGCTAPSCYREFPSQGLLGLHQDKQYYHNPESFHTDGTNADRVISTVWATTHLRQQPALKPRCGN